MNAPLWRHAAFALSVALLPGALAAQSGPALTLQQAVQSARENNPDFLQTANDLRTARSATRAARWDLLPTANASSSLGYTASGEARAGTYQLAASQPAFYTSGYSVSLNYQLSGSKLLATSVARAQQAATQQRIAGSEASLVGQVVQQYLSVLQAQEQVAQADREVARTAEHVRLAQARLQVGAGTPLDLRQAEVQKGQADVKALQQRAALETERLKLGQVMGAPLAPGTQLTSRFELFQPHWAADSLVQIATRNNPTVLAARASVAASRTQIRSARTAYLPSLSMRVGVDGYAQRSGDETGLYNQALAGAQSSYAACQRDNLINQAIGMAPKACGGNPSDAAYQSALRGLIGDQNGKFPFRYTRQPLGAQFVVSLPVFSGTSRQHQVEEARVGAEDAELQVRSLELRLQAEISAATLNLNTAYSTAQLQAQVKQKAAEELRLAQERFRYGAANSIDVTDAQTSLALAEQSEIDAIYNFHKSLAALEALIGQPLR
jgi:outer membrane protein